MPASVRYAIVAIWPLLLFILAGILPAFPQDPAYHQYADQRVLLGLPHFWNVVSNLAIAAAGAFGLITVVGRPVTIATRAERGLWSAMFCAVLVTAWGSVIYHGNPNVYTLYWDRLPITATLALLLAINLAERISPVTAVRAVLPLLILGAWTVTHWIGTESVSLGDLRFYFAFQLICLGGVPLLWALFPPRYSGRSYFVGALAVYGVAILCEHADRIIYARVAFGGHAIKHLLVGVALSLLAVMLTKRKAV